MATIDQSAPAKIVVQVMSCDTMKTAHPSLQPTIVGIDGLHMIVPSSASRLPTEVTLRRISNFRRISSRTASRVHKAKSKPYCSGFLPFTQRNTCDFCVRVSLGLRPVPLREAKQCSPRPRPATLPSHLYAVVRHSPRLAMTAATSSPSRIRATAIMRSAYAQRFFGLSIMRTAIFLHDRLALWRFHFVPNL